MTSSSIGSCWFGCLEEQVEKAEGVVRDWRFRKEIVKFWTEMLMSCYGPPCLGVRRVVVDCWIGEKVGWRCSFAVVSRAGSLLALILSSCQRERDAINELDLQVVGADTDTCTQYLWHRWGDTKWFDMKLLSIKNKMLKIIKKTRGKGKDGFPYMVARRH